jgi:hypothetical protein
MNNDLYMGQPAYNAQQTPVNNYMSTNQNSYQRPADIIDYVNGYNGMANYPIPMGRTGILFDFPNRKFWIKSPGGPQPVLGFNFSPDNYPMNPQMQQPVQPMPQQTMNEAVSREEFNELKSSMNQILEMMSSMSNQNQTVDGQNKPNNKKFNNQKG